MRPRSLLEVSTRSVRDPGSFADACDEFADAFYLEHGNKVVQQAMLDVPPSPTGEAFRDAWIGAMGEHLAQRWGLKVPAWTRDKAHDGLASPVYVPDSPVLRGYLLVASPPPFRARLIFTGSEPLQRARFPAGEPERKVALPWPARTLGPRRLAEATPAFDRFPKRTA
jgi:hypothetical protein